MRLINADGLMRGLELYGEKKVYADVVLELVKQTPTIDAVEVVRCKDCRYFKKIVERSDSGLCYRDLVASAWKENGYCSRGERREESEVGE